MTKGEIQNKYTTVAAQAGDLYFRIDAAQGVLKSMHAKMAELVKEKAQLEEQLKTAVDDAPISNMEPTNESVEAPQGE